MTDKAESIKNHVTIIFLIFILLGIWRPFLVLFPSASLDGGWSAVLGEAKNLGLVFGKNAIFTGASFSPLYSRYFNADIFPFMLLFDVTTIITLSLLFLLILKNRGIYIQIVFLCLLPIWSLSRDALLFSLPFIASLSVLSEGKKPLHTAIALSLFILSAIACLAKFSLFPLGLACAGLADIFMLSRRRFPAFSVVFIVSLFATYVLTESSDPRYFLNFIRWSFETSSGYVDAMGITQSPVRGTNAPNNAAQFEVAFFILTAIALMAVVIRTELKTQAPNLTGIATVFLFSGFLFIAYKAGFHRHDLHSVIAWTSLGIAGTSYFLMRGNTLRQSRIFWCSAAVAALCFGVVFVLIKTNHNITISQQLSAHAQQFHYQIIQLADFLRSPTNWMEHNKKRRQETLSTIAKENPLPEIPGTVDTIDNIQTEIIANGLALRPRPTLQTYGSYTVLLAQLNEGFFKSNQAPDFLIFKPGDIDYRHPAHAEGYLWPLFLTQYWPQSFAQERLILKKRERGLEGNILNFLEKKEIKLGDCMQFENVTSPLFAKIEMKKSLLGKAASVLYKVPPVLIESGFLDGNKVKNRLVWSVSELGLFVSPYVADSADYLSLATRDLEIDPAKIVKSICIGTASQQKWFSGGAASIELFELNRNRLPSWTTFGEGIKEQITKRKFLEKIVRTASNRDPARTRISGDGIFAHAPVDMSLDVTGKTRLTIGFGIDNAAWSQGNNTDGACYEVLANSGSLWRRCLQPLTAVEDRGMQKEEIALPADADMVTLRIECGGNCNFDWTNWYNIKLD